MVGIGKATTIYKGPHTRMCGSGKLQVPWAGLAAKDPSVRKLRIMNTMSVQLLSQCRDEMCKDMRFPLGPQEMAQSNSGDLLMEF